MHQQRKQKQIFFKKFTQYVIESYHDLNFRLVNQTKIQLGSNFFCVYLLQNNQFSISGQSCKYFGPVVQSEIQILSRL